MLNERIYNNNQTNNFQLMPRGLYCLKHTYIRSDKGTLGYIFGGIVPRKRMIDPEFWSDEEVGQWSHTARLFYIALWNFADDEGRLKAHDSLLNSQIFPYDKQTNINKLKVEVKNKVAWYSVSGQSYGFVKNFDKHQTISRPTPSRLPELMEDSWSAHGVLTEDSTLREEKLREVKRREVSIRECSQYDHMMKDWNDFAIKHKTIPQVQTITNSRKGKIAVRLKEPSFKFVDILSAMEKQIEFLSGKNNREWKVSFDWIIENDLNYVKVLELKYKGDDKERKAVFF